MHRIVCSDRTQNKCSRVTHCAEQYNFQYISSVKQNMLLEKNNFHFSGSTAVKKAVPLSTFIEVLQDPAAKCTLFKQMYKSDEAARTADCFSVVHLCWGLKQIQTNSYLLLDVLDHYFY